MKMSLENQLLSHTSAPREMLMRLSWGLEGSPEPRAQFTDGTENPDSCLKDTLTYAPAMPVLPAPYLHRPIMSAQEGKKKYNKQPLSNLAWKSSDK